MAKQTINVGTAANSGGGDPLRNALVKVNENFTEVYAKLTALEDGNVVTDIKGNVFGDDSSLLVDAINNTIPGTVTGTVTPTVFMPPMLSQAEIDALTPEVGMMVYNITTGKFQGYAEDANNDSTTAWADLH
jgi:hypothetical protein